MRILEISINSQLIQFFFFSLLTTDAIQYTTRVVLNFICQFIAQRSPYLPYMNVYAWQFITREIDKAWIVNCKIYTVIYMGSIKYYNIIYTLSISLRI